MNKKVLISLGVIVFVTLLAFRLFFTGRVPIPLDALVGLYYPYRDLYAKEYSRGLPYKNPLITDPVLQQIPWRNLAIDEIKHFQLPLWNPYAFSGYPLFGNVQSAPFYPLNIFFLILPFISAWSILIFLQMLLGGIFMYLYLRRYTVSFVSPIFGAVAFAFSGFFLSWMEWGTVAQTGLWLPLLLLTADHLIEDMKKIWWQLLFIFSLFCSLSAGHLQTFVYVFLVTIAYLFYRLYQQQFRATIPALLSLLIFIVISSVLWIPQLQFILLSGRDADLSWQKEGFFIPLQHLIQFIAPDFFGNPATGNYFGVWNYGEFLGYVGVSTLIFVIIAVIKKKKETLFFLGILFIALLFSVDTFIAHIPYLLHIPFISSTQPTRLLFVIDFCLAILGAKGLDTVISERKQSLFPILGLAIVFIGLLLLFPFHHAVGISDANWLVTRRNLILPIVFLLSTGLLFVILMLSQKKQLRLILSFAFFILLAGELLFVSNKYNSFSKQQYFYPSTKSVSFLTSHAENYRVMSVDRRALPANISTWYKLQSVSGYDPLYLQRYGEFIAALQRRKADISEPFGFQRIITPDVINSPLIDLLGVKYLVSLSDINDPKLKKVFTEGQTQIYQNTAVFDRAFFVTTLQNAFNKLDAMQKLFKTPDLHTSAVVEGYPSSMQKEFSLGKVTISSYTENAVTLSTLSDKTGFLILTDIDYPIWHAKIDGKEVPIYRTDYLFRGVIVPGGSHTVQFNSRLISL